VQLTWEVVDGKAVINGRRLAEWVPDIVGALVASAHPEQVILYGSVARGEDGPNSDIDLLVVLPDLGVRPRHELMGWLSGIATIGASVDIVVTDPAEIERWRDVIGSAVYWPLREGRVVYERAA